MCCPVWNRNYPGYLQKTMNIQEIQPRRIKLSSDLLAQLASNLHRSGGVSYAVESASEQTV